MKLLGGPRFGFLALKPAKLARLPPQAQSPEYIAHGAEFGRAERLNRWRLLAVRVTLALLVAHMMEISKIRRCFRSRIGVRADAIEGVAGSNGKIR